VLCQEGDSVSRGLYWNAAPLDGWLRDWIARLRPGLELLQKCRIKLANAATKPIRFFLTWLRPVVIGLEPLRNCCFRSAALREYRLMMLGALRPLLLRVRGQGLGLG